MNYRGRGGGIGAGFDRCPQSKMHAVCFCGVFAFTSGHFCCEVQWEVNGSNEQMVIF